MDLMRKSPGEVRMLGVSDHHVGFARVERACAGLLQRREAAQQTGMSLTREWPG